MNYKTEELLIITLATVILIATYITINPSITGLAIIDPSFILNDNIIDQNGIQLKQHNITETETTEETLYYTLTFAEENENNKLNKLESLDSNILTLEKAHLLKIKFNNNLENNDKLNIYLKGDNERTVTFCDFNSNFSCENQTAYAVLNYPGIEGNYQVELILEEADGLTIDGDKKLKIDYINASHLEITENTTVAYYYNSDSIESDIIQPSNLSKWDIFISDHQLNNQTINFYYKISQDYMEFTPPYNFSEINSANLQFKLTLNSDNSSTPIINSLTINYIEEITPPCQENWTCTNWTQCTNETQIRTCIDQSECGTQENTPLEEQNCTSENETPQEPPSSGSSTSSGKPSVTRYSAPTATVTQTQESPKSTPIETKTVSQPVMLKSTPESEIIQSKPKIKIIGNSIGFSYLVFLSFLLYRKRKNL